MTPSVFDAEDYKAFLRLQLSSKGSSRGRKSQLADFLGCNPGFVSQVLNGDSQFSLEHAVQVADFLELKSDEREYFLLLVHHAKAGSVKLRDHYLQQLTRLKSVRAEIQSRMPRAKSLRPEDYQTYYGTSLYAAVHMALSIPKYQSPKALAALLNVPERQVRAAIQFLLERDLIVESGGRLQTGPTRLHLNRDSPMITQHHMNWRLEAMKSLPHRDEESLHYSSALTMAKKDAVKIREILLKALGEVETVLGPSPNEEIYSLGIDFFGLDRK